MLSVFSNIDESAELALPVILCTVLAVIVIIVAATLKQRKKEKAAGSFSSSARDGVNMFASEHSHDRLKVDVSKESGLDHWKKQLDDFMSAGIIDRAEYNLLLNKYADRLRKK